MFQKKIGKNASSANYNLQVGWIFNVGKLAHSNVGCSNDKFEITIKFAYFWRVISTQNWVENVLQTWLEIVSIFLPEKFYLNKKKPKTVSSVPVVEQFLTQNIILCFNENNSPKIAIRTKCLSCLQWTIMVFVASWSYNFFKLNFIGNEYQILRKIIYLPKLLKYLTNRLE